MLACIKPWVKNRARMLKTKELRSIKWPDKIGCIAFRSAKTNPTKLTKAAPSTVKKGMEPHPKFCPKEGIHSNRLKNIRIRMAPDISKLCSGFLVDV